MLRHGDDSPSEKDTTPRDILDDNSQDKPLQTNDSNSGDTIEVGSESRIPKIPKVFGIDSRKEASMEPAESLRQFIIGVIDETPVGTLRYMTTNEMGLLAFENGVGGFSSLQSAVRAVRSQVRPSCCLQRQWLDAFNSGRFRQGFGRPPLGISVHAQSPRSDSALIPWEQTKTSKPEPQMMASIGGDMERKVLLGSKQSRAGHFDSTRRAKKPRKNVTEEQREMRLLTLKVQMLSYKIDALVRAQETLQWLLNRASSLNQKGTTNELQQMAQAEGKEE